MKKKAVRGIQPEVIKWARLSIGLSVADVARRLKRSEAEIESWETPGSAAPSYPQLEKLAYEVYKRPLAMFFLPEPPEEAEPHKEFRTLPDADLRHLAPDTHLHIRRAHAYQLALHELFGGANPAESCIWRQCRLSLSRPVNQQAGTVRELLGITLELQLGWQRDEEALQAWREAIEEAGVFVFKAAFRQKDISGFCLRDAEFPLVYLNNSASKTRQIFSLLHELAHLLFSINGLSKFDQSYIVELPKEQQHIEQFCNAIAAEILIPADDFQQQTRGWPRNLENEPDERFAGLAARYGVSREAILRRFLDQRRVSAQFYETRAKFWAAQKKPADGGNWYASQNVYLSGRFAREVVSRHYQQKLTVEQAADLLGIKAKNFSGLEERILRGSMA